MYQGKYIELKDFSGGIVNGQGTLHPPVNAANDADNIIIYIQGAGFGTRGGTRDVSASFAEAGNGIGYYRQIDGDDYLVGITQGSIFQTAYPPDSVTPPTWSTITGAVSISNGATSTWDTFNFNDEFIAFGGGTTPSSPNAPFKWTGTGNAAALGGSPPSAYGAFTANNRAFAYRTSTNPNTIYWSIIGNAEDWTSTGSGSAVIGSLNDDSPLTGAVLVGNNSVLLFKESAIYQMVLTEAPFSAYLYKEGVGAPNKKAIAEVNDQIYFFGTDNKFHALIDGQLINFPETTSFFSPTNFNPEAVRVFNQKGQNYNWIVITGTTVAGSANSAAIWDIDNKCWLKCSTGYRGTRSYVNVPAISSVGPQTYTINDDSRAKLLGKPSVFADLYAGVATDITSFWRSGWLSTTNGNEIVQVNRMILELGRQSSGSVTVTYGYNFIEDQSSTTVSMVPDGSEKNILREIFLTGRGNYFQYKLSFTGNDALVDMRVFSVLLGGKSYGQKRRNVS